MSHSRAQMRGEVLEEEVPRQVATEAAVRDPGSRWNRPTSLTYGMGRGEGGPGGYGVVKGGDGGVGESPSYTEPFLPPGTQLPDMTVPEFCERYKLNSGPIASVLAAQGFKTVKELSIARSINLQDVGLGIGHIAELKAALETLAYDTSIGTSKRASLILLNASVRSKGYVFVCTTTLTISATRSASSASAEVPATALVIPWTSYKQLDFSARA
ncbi:hypothetical protein B0H11DRAFT_2273104 [Mycena galericulata]|nr:hypothetical protein B0H11DRAFT_2273104 [Mycena galericulata]